MENISDQIVKLLHKTSEGELNLYTIAQELQRNPGSIRRVLNSLMKANEIQEIIICPHCGADINRSSVEKRYSVKITIR